MGKVRFDDSASIKAFRETLTAAVLTGQVAPARAGVALTAAKDAEAALFGRELEARFEALVADVEALREARQGGDSL